MMSTFFRVLQKLTEIFITSENWVSEQSNLFFGAIFPLILKKHNSG